MNDNKLDASNFCYWLQGFFELGGAVELTVSQTKCVKEHLALVFNKVTPKLDVIREDTMYDILNTPHTGSTSKPLCGNKKYC